MLVVVLYGIFFTFSLGVRLLLCCGVVVLMITMTKVSTPPSQPIPSILASELYPTAARSAGVAASTAVQWLFNIVVAAGFPAAAARWGAPTGELRNLTNLTLLHRRRPLGRSYRRLASK